MLLAAKRLQIFCDSDQAQCTISDMKIASLADVTEILNAYIPRPLNVRAVYNLDTIRALADFVGNPQDRFRVLHVAGTSGKTSTSYYAAALLKAAGKKVGLTVSPHITNVNERVQIDLLPLDEREFCDELGIFMDEVEKSGLKPTYFEIMMTFAYWEFAQQGVEYAVIEVGLGGLMDGSNIVTRADKVCLITDIGFDHMGILGTTLPEIAAQKAGIIHENNAVFMHEQSTEVMKVFRRTTEQMHGDLHLVKPDRDTALAFLPLYQQRNIAVAEAAVAYALDKTLSQSVVNEAATVHIPGRMETFVIGGKTVILDGAHNPQKIQAMAESVREAYPDRQVAAIVGFVQSKEMSLAENAQIISSLTSHIIVTAFGASQEQGSPSIDTQIVADVFRAAGSDVSIAAPHAEAIAALMARPEPVLLITGSLYLVSYLRPLVLALAHPA